MDFCHIAPTDFLSTLVDGRKCHLVLAHLVETNPEYTKWYNDQRMMTRPTIILDNSAFEMYKQGRDMFNSNDLIEMGHRVNADYIVMSDYPDRHSSYTIDAAIKLGPKFIDEGFKTFFCPQSRINDIQDLIDCFDWASTSNFVHYVGVSILAIPNAYGVERNNKLQRFVSRFMFMQQLKDRGILDRMKENGKKIHLLGMVDGPNEIKLMSQFKGYINSWDSSAAIWAGLNDIAFDNSPTGLLDGKFEAEVDFDAKMEGYTESLIFCAKKNMQYIDSLCKRYL